MENIVRRTVTTSGICEFVLFPWTLSTRLPLRCVKSLVMLTRFLATHADVFGAGNSLIKSEKHCLVTFFLVNPWKLAKKNIANIYSMSCRPEVTQQNACISKSMFYWRTGGEQQFLLYLAGHWFEHVLISPLIYIHLDAYGISQGKGDEGWSQMHTKLRTILLFKITQRTVHI